MTGARRRELLARARLYVCAAIRPDLEAFLDAILSNGVDIVQLRDKDADAIEQLRAAGVFRAAADRHDALFVMNDRADLAAAAGADGVHLGQEDLPPAQARALLGPDAIVGRSTHAVAELKRVMDEPVDYLGVGPVNPTPTKPGRPGVGPDYVRAAAAAAQVPFFVTGGMTTESIPAVAEAGARGFVVVRAITEADDPGAAARAIRDVIDAVVR